MHEIISAFLSWLENWWPDTWSLCVIWPGLTLPVVFCSLCSNLKNDTKCRQTKSYWNAPRKLWIDLQGEVWPGTYLHFSLYFIFLFFSECCYIVAELKTAISHRQCFVLSIEIWTNLLWDCSTILWNNVIFCKIPLVSICHAFRNFVASFFMTCTMASVLRRCRNSLYNRAIQY